MDPGIKILLVEDLSSDAQLAEYEIKKIFNNYNLAVVDTRDNFISKLINFKPDIVVTDFKLPAFDGLEALKIVLEFSPATPVIVLTGSMNEDTAVECMKAGAVDYVIKEHIKRLGPAMTNALKQKELNLNRIEAQKKLEESEKKFRSIFQYHTAVKLIVNSDSGDIYEANNAAADFYGWSVSELQSMNISQINTYPPDKIREEMDKFKNLKNSRFNFKHVKKDGTIVDVEVFSSKVKFDGKDYIHSIIHDVSDKKRSEHNLRLINRAVEQSPVSVIITDDKASIEYVNPGFTAMTGYSFDEIKGKNVSVLSSDFHNDEFYGEMWKQIKCGNEWIGEIRDRKKSGEFFWSRTSISPIVSEEGVVTHFVAIMEDVSEKKAMLENLVTAKEKAEENDRLKTAFLQNMSHEVRTPMNGILGFIDLLKNPELDESERLKYISIVEKSGQRLFNTINNILEISKIEAGQSELRISDVNLGEMMNSLYQFFNPQCETKGVILNNRIDLSDDDIILHTDKHKLYEILTHLLNNAVKFTHSGSIDFGSYKENQDIIFYVTDSGTGIPDDKMNLIFERFVQADPDFTKNLDGSGLGLSIVKAYVEMLGGSIRVESLFGNGSKFYFNVPVN